MGKRILIYVLLLAITTTTCKKEELKQGIIPVAGIERIWAIDDGEKIRRDDINNPLASDENNAVWKDNSIHLFGARNEIVAFQLVIEAKSDGAEEVNVIVSDLENNGSVIPGSDAGNTDPFDYRGRCMELFTEHYLEITSRTPPLWFYAPGSAPSAYYTGWIPDCLVPFSAPKGKGGAPFSIKGKSNQAVWVDILIPVEASTGMYEGNLMVTVADTLFMTIPVSMEVYDFVLPDSTHIHNMFGFYPGSISQRHNVPPGSAAYYDMEARYFQMAHRHRFDLVNHVNSLDRMDQYYKRYYTGDMYSPASGYVGPGENIGNTTFSIGYGGGIPMEYGNSIKTMTRETWWAGSDAWENWFVQNVPGVERHKYLFPDEPDWKGPAGALGTGSMDTIKMQADWTHSNPGIGRNIPCLVTNTIRPVIKGFVDFWSVSSQEVTMNADPQEISFEKAQGHKYGIYNGYRPGMGVVVIDGDAVEFRVMPWIVWKYGMDQYFYWSTNFWTGINVFKNPLTYDNQVNGDGTFFYPGEDYVYPLESRNLKGPMSSIRAKNWRRGVQDYEYLWLARKAGLENEAKTIVDNCVPAALWDARTLHDISWSSRGYVFEQYRKQLAILLSGK